MAINLSGGGEFKFSNSASRSSAENTILIGRTVNGESRKILFKGEPISRSDMTGFTDLEIAALSKLTGHRARRNVHRSFLVPENRNPGDQALISDTAKDLLNNDNFDVSRVLPNAEIAKSEEQLADITSTGTVTVNQPPVTNSETDRANQATITSSRVRPIPSTSAVDIPPSEETTAGGLDHRVRLRPKRSEVSQVYGDINNINNNILAPLFPTHGGSNGLIWPYTPNITYAPVIDYQNHPLAFANQDYYSFAKVPSAAIQVIGQFTAQSPKEAKYALACIHFLRVVTKMHFGEVEAANLVTTPADLDGVDDLQKIEPGRSSLAEPPPKLLFSAYGKFGFKDIPVYVQNFSIDFSDQINHVPIELPIHFGENSVDGPGSVRTTWIPANFVMTVSLQPQIHPSDWNHPVIEGETQYNWDKFASGELFQKSNGGWL